MTITSLVLAGVVGLAGALGAIARYVLGRFIAEWVGSQFPLGTLLINVTGAFAIGFLGGYTTFGTMSWEGVQLARGGSTRLSVLYLAGNVAVGLFAAVLGLVVGRWL